MLEHIMSSLRVHYQSGSQCQSLHGVAVGSFQDVIEDGAVGYSPKSFLSLRSQSFSLLTAPNFMNYLFIFFYS